MKKINILVKRKEDCLDIPLPKYATSGSSGMDLHAACENEVELKPGDIKLVSCGIYLSIPEGYECEIRPRSGLALKHGISILNSPGTIDSDYRGLLGLIMINLGKASFTIKRGDRVAIWATNYPEWVITQFATSMIGAILVTINPAYRTFELEYTLENAEVQTLLLIESFKTSDYRE